MEKSEEGGRGKEGKSRHRIEGGKKRLEGERRMEEINERLFKGRQ